MEHAIGIDLGTTNSLIAYVEKGEPRIISDESGNALVPSVVSFTKERKHLVGRLAKNQIIKNPSHCVYSVKRLMGKSYEDLEKDLSYLTYEVSKRNKELVRINVGQKEYTPTEISSFILAELRKQAENYLGGSVTKAVITVPAYFNDSQRQATKDAGRLAGLEVLRIINEPTAASLSYGLDKNQEGTVAVYDLGGGTFDISILRIKDGVFEVLSTNGDTYLGGDDIDRNILIYFMKEIRKTYTGDALQDPVSIEIIREEAVKAKVALSSGDAIDVKISLPNVGEDFELQLSREKLEELSKPVVDRTIEPCRIALKDAGLKPEDIDTVILVGGSTRMPLIQNVVEEIFRQKPICKVNPDEVVAMGAAIQADILTGKRKDMLLLDITPLSLGIETYGGIVSVLIPRNTTIPYSHTELFTTFVDNQTGVEIHVLQGERDLAKDNRSLAKFQLKGIEPMPAGLPKIEVTFMIDADGILNVSAKDLRTGIAQSMEVTPSYGLAEEEIRKMVKESYEHAEEDVNRRMVIDSRNEASVLINATDKVLVNHRGAVTPEVAENIEAILNELKMIIQTEDHHRIRALTENLSTATQPLAKEVMESIVQQVVKDKRMEDLK